MQRKQFVIGITGGSGVGKTTLIQTVQKKFEGKISCLSLDDYYLPIAMQSKDSEGVVNFDLPTAIDIDSLASDLRDLCEGKSIQQKIYQFNHPDKKAEFKTVIPNNVLIVEGLFVMHYPFIKSLLGYKVFITASFEAQLKRRLKRDVQERNYSKEAILYQWRNQVLPAYQNYIAPYINDVDLVITNENGFDNNLSILTGLISNIVDQ